MIFHLLQYGSVQRLKPIAACRRARRAAIAAVRQVATLAKQFPKWRRGVRPSLVLRPAAAIGRRGLALGGGGGRGRGISTSVWRIMPVSIEWRIESTARSPVVVYTLLSRLPSKPGRGF
jgi:hypothetical protein